MIRHTYSATGTCLILALTCALIPGLARADDGSRERPLRLYATATFGPIGSMYSPNAFAIDGRAAYGERVLWGGELIQAPADSNVEVRLDLVGRIVLKRAATARLSITRTSLDDKSHRLLVASLLNGDMSVKLEQDAGAYIESLGTAFRSSLGANFVISIREGRPAVDIAGGAVSIEAQPPELSFRGRTVDVVNGLPRPVAGSDTINTNTKKKVRIAIQFTKSSLKRASVTGAFSPRYVTFNNQATQIETPAVGRRVELTVDPPIGTIAATQPATDVNGVIPTEFTALTQGTCVIRARVLREPSDPERTEYNVYERIVIIKKLPIWRTRNLVTAAAAAAIVVIIADPFGGGPIRLQGPPR